MHDHRRQQRELVELQPEQEHRRLRADQHPDLLGQLEAVGGLPRGVVEERGHEHPHPLEFVGVQRAPVLEVRDRASATTCRRTRRGGRPALGGIVRTSAPSERFVVMGVANARPATRLGSPPKYSARRRSASSPNRISATSRRPGEIGDVGVVDDEFDLRASAHEVLELGDHLGEGRHRAARRAGSRPNP